MSPRQTKWLCASFVLPVLFACGGGGIDIGGPPSIGMWEPCIGMPGDFVTIYGSNFQDAKNTTSVEFNGTKATVLTYLVGGSLNGIRVKIPPGATSGKVKITTENGSATSLDDYTVGLKVPVPEIEPNEDNPTATAMDKMTQGTGTLGTPSDRDHFRRECMIPGHKYKVKVTPRLVGVVYVDTVGKTLDANGEVIIIAPFTGKTVVGLTGASGSYTVDIDYVGL